jgi:hypothetical protein
MQLRLLFLFVIVFCTSIAIGATILKAQEEVFQNPSKIIIQDARVDSLLMLHKKAMEAYLANEEHNGINGYRIQICLESGNNSKNKASRKKDRFDKRYSRVPSYMTFHQPYFRVRVGDFRTKLEAEAFLKRVVRNFRGAFVIKSKIKLPVLSTR